MFVAVKERNLFHVMGLLEKENINVNWANPKEGNVNLSLLSYLFANAYIPFGNIENRTASGCGII